MSSTATTQGDSGTDSGTNSGTDSGAGTGLPSLTGLRFLAAVGVFLFHTSLLVSPSGPMNPFADQGVATAYASVFGIAGFAGVSFFFVLSGFVLTWSSRPGEPTRSFLRRRVVKIYPNHVVIWAISLLLFAWASGAPSAILPNLLLIHDYFPQPYLNLSVNNASWSLCAGSNSGGSAAISSSDGCHDRWGRSVSRSGERTFVTPTTISRATEAVNRGGTVVKCSNRTKAAPR